MAASPADSDCTVHPRRQPETHYHPDPQSTFIRKPGSNLPLIRRIYKKYPEFIKTEENRYLIDRRQRKACALFSKVGQAFILQPKQPLPLSSMRADEKSLRTLYAMGYDDARESFPQLLEFLSK